MSALLSSLFLLAGSVICLLAAIGILRLPDFFMRMHATTKAGVAGCGLMLVGVGFAMPSVEMWMKVALAVVFLLMTTPIAGHLLARAGYVAGVPLWDGTARDQLEGELPRGQFDGPAMMAADTASVDARELAMRPAMRQTIRRVIVALSHGPDTATAIGHAVALAERHRAHLLCLAIVDTKRLSNVGPVPIGGNYYADRLRRSRIEKARSLLAEDVQTFEVAAEAADLPFSVTMEEGNPAKILARHQSPDCLVIVCRHGWFDHGVIDSAIDPMTHLVRRGVRPVIGVTAAASRINRITFVHDGSAHSDATWEWLLTTDPWPHAAIRLVPDDAADADKLARARAVASKVRRKIEADDDGNAALRPAPGCQAAVFGNESRRSWLSSLAKATRPPLDKIPIVVFG